MAKESPKKTFVLSDESVNCYGFRILTSGIDLTHFLANPIMLWNHTRTYGDSQDIILPIGKWENLRVEDGKLLGEPVFDMEDSFALKIAGKVEKGFIKACSIGIEIKDRSDSSDDVIIGQSRPTVKRCILKEVSITDIPANANAVTLYDEGGNMINLTADNVECAIGTIINNNQNQTSMFKLIALQLGLSETATEAQILAKVQELQALQATLTAREGEIATLKASAQESEKKAILKMVDDAIVAKKLTAEQKAHFLTIGEKMGIESLQVTLASMNGAVRPTTILSGSGGASANPDKKWAEYSSEELEILRESDRDSYVKLYEKNYGSKPDFQ
jgi:HK97 family phage prohead protease